MKTLMHTCLAAGLLFILTGCQNIQGFKPGTAETFNAFSYHGKEIPQGFVSKKNELHKDNGHRFRGYPFGQRHWNF